MSSDFSLRKDAELYGVITLSYDKSLVLPLDDALEFMRLVGKGKIMQGYNMQNMKLLDFDKNIALNIVPDSYFAEIVVQNMLDENTES